MYWQDSVNHQSPFLQKVQALVDELSTELMAFFSSPKLEVAHKTDSSPVTEADYRAEQIISSHLANWLDVPMLSEEGPDMAFEERKDWQQFWLVDPLDGTREFIAKRSEFSVNIALIDAGMPVWGLLLMPGLGEFFCGGATTGVLFGRVGQPYQAFEAIVGNSHRANILQDGTIGVAASRYYGR